MELIEYFSKNMTLSTQQQQIITDLFEKKNIKKGELLLREGNICEYEIFVNQGCLKSYYLDPKGQEIILSFAIEEWWMCDLGSFQEQKPSQMNIESMEDGFIQYIHLENKEKLLKEIPALERFYRMLVQRHLRNYQERMYYNIALSAQERYEHFLQKYPKIALRVPQYAIASFLGISPESLSRIRKKMIS